MRLRSLVDRLRSPSQSVWRAPVQPNIDHTSSHPPSPASVLEGTDVDQTGIAGLISSPERCLRRAAEKKWPAASRTW